MSFSSRRQATRAASPTIEQKYGSSYDSEILALLVRHLGEAEGMNLLDRCALKLKKVDLRQGLPDRYITAIKEEHHDVYRRAGYLINQSTIRYNGDAALQFSKESHGFLLAKYGKSEKELAQNKEILEATGDINQFDACDVQVWQDQFTFQITHYMSHIYRLPPRNRAVLIDMINEEIAMTKFGNAYKLPSLFKYPKNVRPKCFLEYILRSKLEMAVGKERIKEIEDERQELVQWMLMKGLAHPQNPLQALFESLGIHTVYERSI